MQDLPRSLLHTSSKALHLGLLVVDIPPFLLCSLVGNPEPAFTRPRKLESAAKKSQ